MLGGTDLGVSVSANSESGNRLRFPGLRSAAREFFRALEREPCPSLWPAGDRVTYATYVLGPLKALVVDLAVQLEDATPAVALVPRVGQSLTWVGVPDTADCPVSTVRAWLADSDPSTSPLLSFSLSSSQLRVSLDCAENANAVPRLRALLLSDDERPRRIALDALARGWDVEGPRLVEADDGSLPEALRPWMRQGHLRITRVLDWEEWLDEPGLAVEVADRFRELLPLMELMRPAREPSAARPA